MKSHMLVTAEWLAARAGAPDVLVVDCRKDLADPARAPRDYAEAHVPGAVRAELDRDLSDLSRHGLGRHPLPDASAFSKCLSRWGWVPDRTVIAYDDAGGALAAARLWWMLRIAGVTRAAVLDGGIAAWRAEGQPVTGDVPAVVPTAVDLSFDAAELVGYDELAQGLRDDTVTLIDARAGARYRGEVEPLDRVAGHVPGALNRPYGDNLDATGRFKQPDALRREFEALIGDRDPRRVVHMCGSGVTACHNLLAMEHAGLNGSRVFAPSWSGWSSDPARPVETGSSRP
ncbi:MAG: sulfurtransferase [Xanthomonadales bacterium]|nr:sulfurtransferase [Xanthomonadales bacterium]